MKQEMLEKELDKIFSTNPYVDDFKNNKFVYTKDFYMVLYKKIESGMTYVEAYESMGFDTKVLGKNRAESAGKRARKMHKEGKLNYSDPSCYEGSASLEDIESLDLTLEEKYAYAVAQIKYLKYIEEVKKTVYTKLQEKPYSPESKILLESDVFSSFTPSNKKHGK